MNEYSREGYEGLLRMNAEALDRHAGATNERFHRRRCESRTPAGSRCELRERHAGLHECCNLVEIAQWIDFGSSSAPEPPSSPRRKWERPLLFGLCGLLLISSAFLGAALLLVWGLL